jgi:thymidylate kinase
LREKMSGRLIVFEGPDGVGKTTLSRRTVNWLTSRRVKSRYVSFPGCEQGSLGKLVYDLHHNPERFDCKDLDPTARQLLHVAAHVDALRKIIGPALAAGESIVMDRFWWSTVVYGRATSADDESIRLMIELEKVQWAGYSPSLVFLLHRNTSARAEQTPDQYRRLQIAYSNLAQVEEQRYEVKRISTDGTPDDTFSEIAGLLQSVFQRVERRDFASQRQLPLGGDQPGTRSGPLVFSKLAPAVASQVYDTYWRFAAKRQDVFFRRVRNLRPPWTDDPILMRFKFTNAYRASDRTSQYLIKDVIYSGPQDPNNIFFRTLLFKLFNKIETWKLLEQTFGSLTCAAFDIEAFDRVLTSAMARKQRIYSAAYIMPSGGKHGESKKHRNHLRLLKMMLADGVPIRLTRMKRMRDAFELLLSYPMIGDFLAYQYVTDLNYSCLTDFSEREFVVPGPGARDGIRKCFTNLGGLDEADIIRMVTDRQNLEFERRGIDFQSLWGRPLQFIDCQNLFCEVDKYARYAHPEVIGITGRTRIKQMFRCTPSAIEYWYPPKWHLNESLARDQEIANADVRS